MRFQNLVENAFIAAAEMLYRRLPQPVPNENRLRQCKLISHRGEHSHPDLLENTISAFEAAVTGGVWGIEFDVRWTKDLHPVVIHDPDTRRLFGSATPIHQSTFRDLVHNHPLIPHLSEVVKAFGGRIHLMVELKSEPYPDPDDQRRALENIFQNLVPQRDYHLISLSPDLFDIVDFVPDHALLPIAQANVGALSRLAASKGYGGILGHFVMVTDAIVKKHLKLGQTTGTGFADSANCLFRELNRGIAWIFSNRAVAMQSVLDACLGISCMPQRPHKKAL